MQYLEADPAREQALRRRPQGRLIAVEDAGERLDRLYETCRPEFPFSVRRDAAFACWRFLEHPSKTYVLWAYRGLISRPWKAWAVLCHEGTEAVLVDILAPDEPAILTDLWFRLAGELRAQGITRVRTWLPAGHFLGRALQAAGFTAQPEPLGIVPGGRVFHPDLPFAWAAENLYYTMADADLY